MEEQVTSELQNGENQEAASKRKKVWLTFREAGPQHYPYIKDLAQREIGITLRRLPQHKSLLIYQGRNRIGFISYRRMGENYLYIYVLAFEKEAQNQVFARTAAVNMIKRERKLGPVDGIFARIHKTNQVALHAAMEKYGYKVVDEQPRYYVLFLKSKNE